jgi:hypothetical protein
VNCIFLFKPYISNNSCGWWDKVFTDGNKFKKSIELEQRRKIVTTTFIHYKTSGEEQGFVTFATNIFFCAENLKLYKPPSRQIKTKQTFDLFCYETLQDNEYYS